MNELLQTYDLLAAGLRADPLLCLASAVVCLDPLWKEGDDDWDVPHDEDGALSIALRVTRKAFPDIYVQAVDAIRRGATYTELDSLICGGITERGIPLDNLEWIGYGVPLPAYGAELDDPDCYAAHPDVLPVLACFGISPEPNAYTIDVPDCAYTAGRMIAADLQSHDDEHYRQASWLMQWLFSCSGNSSVDFSYVEQCEFQPLSWDQDDLNFASEIIEEADGIMADALAGLAFINDQPDLLAILQCNVKRIYKAINQQNEPRTDPKVRLTWHSNTTAHGA